MNGDTYQVVERNSSVELYRILAVLAVFIGHWNGWFVGGVPTIHDFNFNLYRVSQVFISAMTSMCVNMFVLISGYFGLKLKFRTFSKLYFSLLAVYLPCYLITAAVTKDFKLSDFLFQFFVFSRGGYFILCYAMLVFISPVLNSFFERGKNVIKWVGMLITVEFWFDCIMNISELGVNHGYSLFHFCVVYMVGRCVFVCRERLITISSWKWICYYIVLVLGIVLMYICGFTFYSQYSNPLVISCAICVFIPFLKKELHNRFINYIAKSSLIVYVLQVTVPIQTILIRLDNYLLQNFDYFLYIILSIVSIISFIFIFVIYDKLSQIVINPINTAITKLYERKFN